jgi:hypothetical protein
MVRPVAARVIGGALMIRKTVLAAGIGAVLLLGATGAAVAAESDTTPATPTPSAGPTSATPTPRPSPTAQPHRNGRHGNVAFPGEFAQWTTFDAKTNTSTVHDGIRGQVSAVSTASITVKAANGTAQTFAVDANTMVRARSGTISQVKVGDQVVVVGTGQGSLTATQVDDHAMSSGGHNRKHR